MRKKSKELLSKIAPSPDVSTGAFTRPILPVNSDVLFQSLEKEGKLHVSYVELVQE